VPPFTGGLGLFPPNIGGSGVGGNVTASSSGGNVASLTAVEGYMLQRIEQLFEMNTQVLQ
jgi:hypothetical protein